MSKNYRKQIAEIKAGIRKLADTALVQTALSVQREVVMNTPVDTGRARSNWFMGNGSAPRHVTEDTTAQNLMDGIAQAQKIKSDDTVYISNNLPYINRLNDGHSQQAPAGFVEKAVQVGKQKVEEIASKGLPRP